ncbi:serine hydrolase domain-containing protein [Streptomyces sp. RKAG290]|uniref:serine hydrolase domain-containing protein n=1 Tax=Streptomyces sp. RKAG290 TaxID=2888348 RepID=UPI0020335CB3|nr:serine hydrolase domain-containing protein [Streptomyces sp. RKAG290]MCM2415115.1 beta-lactamase family protein [Streptomyces sp. RKAG290]
MSVRKALVAATAVGLVAALAGPATATVPHRESHGATRTAMDAAVKDGVPGVTATATDGHGTWSATSGVGDLRTNRPRSTDDHYRIASLTKTFVSTVVLQLEAEGRLSLDDKVSKWLPGVVAGHGNDGSAITLRRLLNHTSGIFDYLADEDFQRDYFLKDGFLEHRYDTAAPEQLVAIAMAHEPDFTPGASWHYSNTNYVLASMVIQKVTGHSYAAEIDRRIVKRLDLRSTLVPDTSPEVPQPSSRAYGKLATTSTGPTYDVTELNPSLAGGSGAMISDSSDLNRFYRALLKGKLLPPEQLKEMKTTVKAVGIPHARYGLGLADRKLSCGVHVWGHSGGIHGSSSESVTTADGRHALSFNFNGDWSGDSDAVIEAEFCGR